MNVHNIMEEIVAKRVDAAYEFLKETGVSWLSCDCGNCRLDAVCYVLNRISPKYVVSGRGVTHAQADIGENKQLQIDIDALANVGIRLISETKRPFHTLPRKDCTIGEVKIPVFNFPTFTGSVLDGTTFEPVVGARILLKRDGEIVEMVDRTWANPAVTYKSTKGNYSFWIKPLQTDAEGKPKKFTFSVEVTAEGYDSAIYSFELPLSSEMDVRTNLDSTFSLKIKDIVLFSKDIKNTMDD